MCCRSASGIQRVRSGVETKTIHTATQSNPTAPVITNDHRHDSAEISHATSGALSAGPNSVPAWISPTARPRSVDGAQSRTDR